MEHSKSESPQPRSAARWATMINVVRAWYVKYYISKHGFAFKLVGLSLFVRSGVARYEEDRNPAERALLQPLHRLSLAVRVQAVVGVRGDDSLGEAVDGDVGRPLVHVRHGATVELHVDEKVVDAGGEERRDEAHDPQRGLGLLGGCSMR